ncbi:MAG TPA: hypothetical protein VHE30_14755 [Polyangiaceae bacterium]|nr:hypothetical protein [Polyangiaceae bacterium]
MTHSTDQKNIHDHTDDLRDAADRFTDRVDDVADRFSDTVEDMADRFADTMDEAADRFAHRARHVTSEMGVARERLGVKLERALGAAAELSRDAERPARQMGQAIEDLADEVRRSFERITRPPTPRWYERLMFWR